MYIGVSIIEKDRGDSRKPATEQRIHDLLSPYDPLHLEKIGVQDPP